MHLKKHLGFSALRKIISERLCEIEDCRQQGKVDSTLHDCLMSAFAMMFFQDPSLLEFQRRMQESINHNNLKTIFHVEATPKDTQLRDVLDQCPSDKLENVYADFFYHLQRSKQLEAYRFLNGMYLMPVDGSQYFSSEKICCPSCLTKTSQEGVTRYHHQILQAVIVHPDSKQVIPLAPETIENTDGTEKQDCEINAGKRLIHKIRKTKDKSPTATAGWPIFLSMKAMSPSWSKEAGPAGRLKTKHSTRLKIKATILNTTSVMDKRICARSFFFSTCWHFSFIRSWS